MRTGELREGWWGCVGENWELRRVVGVRTGVSIPSVAFTEDGLMTSPSEPD